LLPPRRLLVNEIIQYWKGRCGASTHLRSLFALIEPGSCFAARAGVALPPTAYMLDGGSRTVRANPLRKPSVANPLPQAPAAPAVIRLDEFSRALRRPAADQARVRFCGSEKDLREATARGSTWRPRRRRSPGHRGADDWTGRRDAAVIEERASFSPTR